MDVDMTPRQRLTSKYMSKFELSVVIAARSQELCSGSRPLVPCRVTDVAAIAKMELVQKKLVYTVRRWLPDMSYEDWNVNDLLLTKDLLETLSL